MIGSANGAMDTETVRMVADDSGDMTTGEAVCLSCNASLPSTARFCPLCGLAISNALMRGLAPEPAGDSSPAITAAQRTSVKRIVIAGTVLGAGALAVLALAASVSGDGSSAQVSADGAAAQGTGRTPATRLAAAPTSDATSGAAAVASPSPRATVTPTPVLPTPIVAGLPLLAVPNYSPSREIVDTINRSASAYTAAMSRLDESLLDSVFTGDALAYYTAKIHDLRAAGSKSTPTLADIQLVSLQPGESTARVTTREHWRIRTSATSCTLEGYEVSYSLLHQGNSWLVDQNAFQQASLGPC